MSKRDISLYIIDIKDAVSYAKEENFKNKEIMEFLNSIEL